MDCNYSRKHKNKELGINKKKNSTASIIKGNWEDQRKHKWFGKLLDAATQPYFSSKKVNVTVLFWVNYVLAGENFQQ